jgi:NRAMP (natural resistance-associated macrophage protein)-like metal ion transporter
MFRVVGGAVARVKTERSSSQRRPRVARRSWRGLTGRLGPGLITGAADDDPSGIATYSQAGAQFGVNMLWTVVFTYPLMVAVQMVSARIGRVTGLGLAANLRRVMPSWSVAGLVGLLFVANTVNIGADIAAMGAAGALLVGWNADLIAIGFALGSLLLQVIVPYHRYVALLKWLTLSLFAYVGVVLAVRIDWGEVALRTVSPQLALTPEAITTLVALFGTTISPYLFFWQSSEEVEDLEQKHGHDLLHGSKADGARELRRIRWDTLVGMAFSNLIAFFIILTTAVTLHASGKTEILTSADAAEALRPIAGPLAFGLFAAGIVGTGLLAIPVLAGSVAYGVGETFGWKIGLERKPAEAAGFYTVIAASTLLGLGVVFLPIDPIQALFWSAVLNGVISVPIMAAMMLVGSRRHEMGRYVVNGPVRLLGWAATLLMGVVVSVMLVGLFRG